MAHEHRYWRFFRSVVLSGVLVFLPGVLQAQEGAKDLTPALDRALADLHISFSNTIRTEYYNYTGDGSASPYRYEGAEPYDEFNLNFARRKTPYDTWRGQVSGVVNGSDYRASDHGFIPERLNLFREQGDVPVPYRVEAGDFFGFFSYRSLQRSLKGVQVELQPAAGPKGTRHSVVMLAGANQPTWKHLNAEENVTGGLSYLVENPRFGRYNFNFVHNRREGDNQLGTLDRSQEVYSLAGEKGVSLGSQLLTVEGEVGMFKGDHDGVSGAASGQGRSDWGLYFQAKGRGRLPLTYRFRYEQYGQDYRPEGAAVTSDRRSVEVHAGWHFAGGLEVRGRIQSFRDNWKTSNPQDTLTYGLSASGPVGLGLVKGLNASLDTFLQHVEDRHETVDQDTRSVNLNLNIPVRPGWNGRLGLSYQGVDPKDTSSSITRQFNIGVDHSMRFHGFRGSISPGLVIRNAGSPGSESRDKDLVLASQIARDSHNLGLNLSYNCQPRDESPDVTTFSYALNYRYSAGKDTVGIEYSRNMRNPDPNARTDSCKVALFWTHYFEKPVKKVSRGQEERIAMAGTAPAPREPDISRLVPGTGMDAAMKVLEEAGIRGPVEQGDMLIFETRYFGEIEQRQRLVLVREGGRLRKAAIIVDFQESGVPDGFMQTFERIRNLLIDRYGRPTNFYNKGEISPNLAGDINSGAFIRITEWSLPGGTLRFGIPRRLDGKIRMEVQFAREFPPVTYTLWSLEEVR